MKKHAGKLLLLLLATLMVFVLAACNDTTGTGGNGGNGGGDDPTAATHTVHFDAAGGQDLEGKYDVEVKHGGTVESPKLNGKPLEPLRTGYDFTGWVYGTSGADFIFSDTAEEDETPTVVTDDITISATWSAKSYTHTLVTSANSSLYPFGGSEANGFWNAAGTVSLDKGEDEADPAFVTRYGDDEAVGDVPVAVSDSEDDWMVYWYYVTTETVDGKTVVNEVPFTTSRTGKDDTSELKLLEDFTGLSSLVLYPKMHSQLPDVDLTFGETGTLTVKLGDFADKADVPTPSESAGYAFDGWYYIVTTGEGEDEVTTEYAFVPFEAAENEDNADEDGVPITAGATVDVGVAELGDVLLTLLYYGWASALGPGEGWLVLSLISWIAVCALVLFVMCAVVLWPPFMLHTGLRNMDAFRMGWSQMSGKLASAMLTMLVCILPFAAAMAVTGAVTADPVPRVVLDGVAIAVCIPYYVSMMYVLFYDVTGTERMDLNRTDLWSKKVVRKDKRSLKDTNKG